MKTAPEPLMKPAGILLRLLAILTAPFAVVQVYEPVRQLGIRLNWPQGTEATIEACRELAIGMLIASAPAVLWVIADMSRHSKPTRSNDAPPKNPGISN